MQGCTTVPAAIGGQPGGLTLKTPFLALATALVLIAGGPVISLAQDSGNAESSSETRFRKLVVEPKGLVASPAPIETPAASPKIALPAEGVESPKGTGKGETKTLPIIVEPEGKPAPKEIIVKADPKLTAPPPSDDELIELLGEGPATKPAPPKIIVTTPPKVEAPAATAKVEEESVVGAAKLYDVLKSKGYDIKVEKSSEYGQYVFYVTKEGYEYSNLLVVDGEYGKVLKRQKTKLAKTYKPSKTYEDNSYEEPAYEDDSYGNDSYGNSGSDGY
jgi:hypothetical protein